MNKETKERIKKFVTDREWDKYHSPENLAKSICIEASELLECFQWGEEYKIEDVKDELADVLIYTLSMAYDLGLKPEEIIERKIHIVDERSK